MIQGEQKQPDGMIVTMAHRGLPGWLRFFVTIRKEQPARVTNVPYRQTPQGHGGYPAGPMGHSLLLR